MAKIPFKVSARTAKLIGQENFANAEGAIIELVKNAYDADAKNCLIIFDNADKNGAPSIYIIDNGIGMGATDIEDNWMNIGTDDKLYKSESDDGRIKTGAKGIGRFALDRLGFKSEMLTISRKTKKGASWSVDWADFDKQGIAIHQVEADLNIDAELDFIKLLKGKFPANQIILEQIESIDFTSGTILKIQPPKDEWEENSIQRLFDNLEVLIPPKEQPDFDVYLFSTKTPSSFGKINSAFYDDFDYKVEALYSGGEANSVEIEITRNELCLKQLKELYGEVFLLDRMRDFPYTLDVFKKEKFKLNFDLKQLPGFSKITDDNLLKQIGAFEFSFYFLKNTLQDDRSDGDLRKYPYKPFLSANRKAWLKKFSGVKIFRDDFRVRPYGENGQDWLSLGDRQAKNPGGPGQKIGGYRIGPNQIAGTVKISRLENAVFQDKSGREGIQENDAFELFKNILIEIISIFERDRNIIMHSLSTLAKARHKNEAEKKRAQEEADRILRESEGSEDDEQENFRFDNQDKGREPTETEKLLARAAKSFQQEIVDKSEEIRFLRALASVGLIISSFAHEVKSLRTRLEPRSNFLLKELKKHIKPERLKTVNEQENPFYMLQLMRAEDLKLKHWLDYSLSSLKRDKRTRSDIVIFDYFKNFKSTWRHALAQRNVELENLGPKHPTLIIRAFEVDLDAIFNNLLSNSLSALKERKDLFSKKISINWSASEDEVLMTFTDNGTGLAPEYQKEPMRIFEYNESSKRDRKGNKTGTGMGLYIVQLVVNDYANSGIELLGVKDGFSIGVRIPLKK